MRNEQPSLIGYKKKYWNLGELKAYIEERYEIVFSDQQSYYEIFDSAGLSWKKSQKRNPKTDPELVKKKTKELTQWLEAHRNEIELGELVVFFQDECHLLWEISVAMFGVRRMKGWKSQL